MIHNSPCSMCPVQLLECKLKFLNLPFRAFLSALEEPIACGNPSSIRQANVLVDDDRKYPVEYCLILPRRLRIQLSPSNVFSSESLTFCTMYNRLFIKNIFCSASSSYSLDFSTIFPCRCEIRVSEVEGMKILVRMLPIWATCVLYAASLGR
jgi:hypothetical protein